MAISIPQYSSNTISPPSSRNQLNFNEPFERKHSQQTENRGYIHIPKMTRISREQIKIDCISLTRPLQRISRKGKFAGELRHSIETAIRSRYRNSYSRFPTETSTSKQRAHLEQSTTDRIDTIHFHFSNPSSVLGFPKNSE